MKHLSAALITLSLGALTSGCGADVGDGQVQGSLLIPLCTNERPADHRCTPEASCGAFDLDVDFFAVETIGDRVLIRIQRGGRAIAEADGLLIDIPDRAQLPLGTPVQFAADGPVRAALSVLGRCPDSPQSFRLEGAVTFEAFGVDVGDRVAAAFEGVEVFDGRTGDRLGQLRGDFDFRVAKGSTRQRYVDL